MTPLGTPEPLAPTHGIERFACGVPSLDDWLKRRARQNQTTGASRTFVSADAEGQVGAYYALAASAITAVAATGRLRRNMPAPIPVIVLGRLAVTSAYKGQGIGRALFQDAARRTLFAAEAIGVRGLLVHALSEDAKNFYERLGLDPSPLDPMTLMVTMADLRAALG